MGFFVRKVLLFILGWKCILASAQDCQREGTIDCRSALKSRYRTLDGSCTHAELDNEEVADGTKHTLVTTGSSWQTTAIFGASHFDRPKVDMNFQTRGF